MNCRKPPLFGFIPHACVNFVKKRLGRVAGSPPTSGLSHETVAEVLAYLDAYDATRAGMTCRQWKEVAAPRSRVARQRLADGDHVNREAPPTLLGAVRWPAPCCRRGAWLGTRAGAHCGVFLGLSSAFFMSLLPAPVSLARLARFVYWTLSIPTTVAGCTIGAALGLGIDTLTYPPRAARAVVTAGLGLPAQISTSRSQYQARVRRALVAA
jgi:hypothetical protein